MGAIGYLLDTHAYLWAVRKESSRFAFIGGIFDEAEIS